MLNSLSISNFKCFNKKQSFSLKSLNIFTGLNGRGKSTVFQSLLMLSQSLNKNGNIEYLNVNGNYISLDLFDDILNFNCGEDKIIRFEIKSDHPEINDLHLGYKEYTDRVGIVSEFKINSTDFFQKGASISDQETKKSERDSFLYSYPKEAVNSLFRNYYFISADRLGPTIDERKADEYVNNPLGIMGEHRLNILSSNDLVINTIRCDKQQGTLLEEATKWLSYIMDGAKINLQGKDKQDSVLQLLLNNNPQCKKEVKAINFGYGYSYILSIILIALLAKKGSTVFIENPEAHLHPRAQARLTELLCKLAESGVQVFIETHSEHVLNKIRLITLKDDIKLTHENVSIYYFGENFEVTKLDLDKNAQFTNDTCLDGFFDQQEIELAEILKLGLLK